TCEIFCCFVFRLAYPSHAVSRHRYDAGLNSTGAPRSSGHWTAPMLRLSVAVPRAGLADDNAGSKASSVSFRNDGSLQTLPFGQKPCLTFQIMLFRYRIVPL